MRVPTMFLALAYNPVNENEIFTLIVNWICLVTLIAGVIYGAVEFGTGYIDESPSKKQHAIKVLIVGVSIPSLLFTIMNLILG